jgi:hypothetical protein
MGFFKGGLLTVSVILLFLSLLAMNSFLTISMSLSYDNVKAELGSVVEEIARGEMDLDGQINNNFDELVEHCVNNSEYNLVQGELNMIIPCKVVDQGSEAVVDYGINQLIEEVYYKDYNCDLWDCLKEEGDKPFVLVSEKAHDYWQGKFYLCLFLVMVFSVLSFFFVENKNSAPIAVGIPFVIASLPFAKLTWLLSFLAPAGDIMQFFTVFFSKSYIVFLIGLILGIVLIGVGIVLKLLKVGQYVSDKAGKVKNFVDAKLNNKSVVEKKDVEGK